MLDDAPDIEIVGTAATGEEALEKIAALQSEVVLLDYKLPGMSGVEVARALRQQGWSGQIVALSGYTDPATVNEMLEAGARAYLLKTGMVYELAFALRSVAQGHRWFSPEIWEILTQSENADNPIRSEEEEKGNLTKKQREILYRVALGRTDEQIAIELGITTKAINKQLARILERLDAPNRANAVYKAMKRRWL